MRSLVPSRWSSLCPLLFKFSVNQFCQLVRDWKGVDRKVWTNKVQMLIKYKVMACPDCAVVFGGTKWMLDVASYSVLWAGYCPCGLWDHILGGLESFMWAVVWRLVRSRSASRSVYVSGVTESRRSSWGELHVDCWSCDNVIVEGLRLLPLMAPTPVEG